MISHELFGDADAEVARRALAWFAKQQSPGSSAPSVPDQPEPEPEPEPAPEPELASETAPAPPAVEPTPQDNHASADPVISSGRRRLARLLGPAAGRAGLAASVRR
ncbi:hypothetical protein [Blastococcus sp. TF02-8]|uniref:hypothetical protein n=1 Tax=Blastococcus sp. TF02-8 TaxID=2250574 RepID=UPI0011BEC33B|nr:hypothetical protein [Blastococcus sp. TF02-8]